MAGEIKNLQFLEGITPTAPTVNPLEIGDATSDSQAINQGQLKDSIQCAATPAAGRALTTHEDCGTLVIQSLSSHFYFDTASAAVDDGSTILIPDDITHPAPGRWLIISGAGGSAGSTKQRVEVVFDGDVPPEVVPSLNGFNRIKFSATSDRDVQFQIRVMDNYVGGTQIFCSFAGYNDVGSGNIEMETVATLYQSGDDMTATTNQRTSTQTIAIGSTNRIESGVLEISDGSGQINATAITAGDLIQINFKRKGSDGNDTNTGSLFVTDIEIEQ